MATQSRNKSAARALSFDDHDTLRSLIECAKLEQNHSVLTAFGFSTAQASFLMHFLTPFCIQMTLYSHYTRTPRSIFVCEQSRAVFFEQMKRHEEQFLIVKRGIESGFNIKELASWTGLEKSIISRFKRMFNLKNQRNDPSVRGDYTLLRRLINSRIDEPVSLIKLIELSEASGITVKDFANLTISAEAKQSLGVSAQEQ